MTESTARVPAGQSAATLSGAFKKPGTNFPATPNEPTTRSTVWFVATAGWDLWRKLGTTRHRFLAATGLAAIAGMLSAGLFEHNFGDSEFLMLFLVLVTLPFAADRTDLP